MIRMHAKAKVNIISRLGQRAQSGQIFQINGDYNQPLAARLFKTIKHRIPVIIEVMKIEVTVRVNEMKVSHPP